MEELQQALVTLELRSFIKMGVIITPGPSAAAGIPPPIGSVLAWLKDYTSTPALPDEFVECNGQVLDDPDSVYDEQTIPNLNGGSFFFIGYSESGLGGGTVDHTHTGPNHSHNFSGTTGLSQNPIGAGLQFNTGTPNDGHDHNFSGFTNYGGTGATGAADNIPPYYTVVWVMRIK